MPFPLHRRLTQAERNRIVNLLATNTNPKKIADDTNCSYHTVMRIKRNIRLFDSHTPPIEKRQGRPPKLNDTILEALKTYVSEKPTARLDEMVKFIEAEFGVKVDESTVSRTVRQNQWRAPLGGPMQGREMDRMEGSDKLDPELGRHDGSIAGQAPGQSVQMGGEGMGPRSPEGNIGDLMGSHDGVQSEHEQHSGGLGMSQQNVDPSDQQGILSSQTQKGAPRRQQQRSNVEASRPTISISSATNHPVLPSSPNPAQGASTLPSHLSPQQLQNHYSHLRSPLSNHQILRSPIVPHQPLLRPTSPAPPNMNSNSTQQQRTPLQNPQSLTLPPPSPILPPASPHPSNQQPTPPPTVTPAPAPDSSATDKTVLALLEQNKLLLEAQKAQQRELSELRHEISRLTGYFASGASAAAMSPQGNAMMGGHMMGQGHMGQGGFGGMHPGNMHGHGAHGGHGGHGQGMGGGMGMYGPVGGGSG